MSMNKIVFNVFFCIIFFLVSTVFSQVPQIKGGKTVKSGDNTVDWKGKLMGDKNIKLIATFDPGQKDFVPNSAYAISLNELQWNGNGQNSTKLARFNLTLPPKDFKNYPTYFSGYFQGKEKGGTEYDRWNASELLLFAPDEHTYYNITESQREIVDNNSGVCYNQTKIASDWNQYSVNKINPPLDYLPQKNDRFQNLRKVLSNHVTALAKQAGITNNASQGAYTVVQRSIPQVAWEKKETEKNLQCKGKDSNGNLPNPPCQKMERDYFMITVNVNLGAKIYLPEWKQLEEQLKNKKNHNISNTTITNWNTMYDKFETHEKKHADYVKKVAQECRKIEKTVFVIEICNHRVTPADIDELIFPIKEQIISISQSIGRENEDWCQRDSANINNELNKINDFLLNQ